MVDTFWTQHPALSYSIMILLGLIICWFVKREFNHFDKKLSEMCKAIAGKADKSVADIPTEVELKTAIGAVLGEV